MNVTSFSFLLPWDLPLQMLVLPIKPSSLSAHLCQIYYSIPMWWATFKIGSQMEVTVAALWFKDPAQCRVAAILTTINNSLLFLSLPFYKNFIYGSFVLFLGFLLHQVIDLIADTKVRFYYYYYIIFYLK